MHDNTLDIATQEEIQHFLHGNDPEKYIVALEYGWSSSRIYKNFNRKIRKW